jgi:transglutaminase-like putative cysteine protease
MRVPLALPAWLILAAAAAPAQTASAPASRPHSRVYECRQTVKLAEIPKSAKRVRMWIPIPEDHPAQRVLDFQVKDAPGTWAVVAQAEHGTHFLYVEAAPDGRDSLSVATTASIQRDPVRIEVAPAGRGKITDVHKKVFAEYLDRNAPNMQVTDRIQAMADKACGPDDDVFRQATTLWNVVCDDADHYSKDPTKPKCGRGNAEDCLNQGGGCCTDMHSLFIALARARSIPTRIWFGYRLQAKNEGKDVDPGYRCWVEYFVPDCGWIPTDIVVGDAGDRESRAPWITALDERRIVLCEGRNLELSPKQDGPRVNNMIVGYAEIDEQPVPLLPDKDGRPSPLTRTVLFTERPALHTTFTQN